jgi:hypothetical protein
VSFAVYVSTGRTGARGVGIRPTDRADPASPVNALAIGSTDVDAAIA